MNRSRLDPSQVLPMSRDAAIGMILPERSSVRAGPACPKFRWSPEVDTA